MPASQEPFELGACISPRLRPARDKSGMALAIAVLASAAVLFATQFVSVRDYMVDDAFITFSYSKNVALGHGPVFSHGARVEGYSNFLWMLLVALPLAIRPALSPLMLARLLCVPFILVLAWAVFRTIRAATLSRPMAAVGVCLLATSTDLAVALLSGLESVAYTSLVAVAFALHLASGHDRRWRIAVGPAFAGVALMRIDGFIPLGLMLAWEAARALRRPHALRRLAIEWGPSLGIYVLWFFWRWRYYGLPLPSSYYAKSLLPTVEPERGHMYVWHELLSSRLALVFVAIGVLLWARRRKLLPIVAFVLIHLAYVVRVGGDWMPFGHFILPVVPLVVCLLVVAASDVWRTTAHAGIVARVATWSALAATALAVGLGIDHRIVNSTEEEEKLFLILGETAHVRRLRKAAPYLALAVPAGRRLVTDYAGVFGYYTNAYVLDMWGLCTPEIALKGDNNGGILAMYGKTCPSCYPELSPEFFHTVEPLVRDEQSFSSAEDVILAVWQQDLLGPYVDFVGQFAVGRVLNETTRQALFFLERRGRGFSSAPRSPAPGFIISYPFEPDSHG